MRKIIILTLALCVLLANITFAAEKPNTAILYYDNLNASAPTKIELKEYYLTKLTEKLSPSHNIIDGEYYIEKFKSMGIIDLAATDRSKIIPILQPDHIDYVVIIDMMPMIRKHYEWNSDKIIAYQHLKVIDVHNNRTIYNTRFAHGSRSASAKKHVEELYKKSEEALLTVLPK